MHGYDITDHNRINPEIGSYEELMQLLGVLKDKGMGLLLDVVPNHMGVGYGTNLWWADVMENGRASEYANFFDIDWNPLKPELRNKVLLPILGNQYGEELEAGHIVLGFRWSRLPSGVFRQGPARRSADDSADFSSLGARASPAGGYGTRVAGAAGGAGRACRPIPLLNRSASPGDSAKLRSCCAVLRNWWSTRARYAIMYGRRWSGSMESQAIRTASMRCTSCWRRRCTGWRIGGFQPKRSTIAASSMSTTWWDLRMEDPQVFAATQKLIRHLLAEDAVIGLRVDHPDGMFNPPQYFMRLQMLFAAAKLYGPVAVGELAENGIEMTVQTAFGQHALQPGQEPFYVVVEKILAKGETFPREWPVSGTVGYEFANAVTGLFIEARNQKKLHQPVSPADWRIAECGTADLPGEETGDVLRALQRG